MKPALSVKRELLNRRVVGGVRQESETWQQSESVIKLRSAERSIERTMKNKTLERQSNLQAYKTIIRPAVNYDCVDFFISHYKNELSVVERNIPFRERLVKQLMTTVESGYYERTTKYIRWYRDSEIYESSDISMNWAFRRDG